MRIVITYNVAYEVDAAYSQVYIVNEDEVCSCRHMLRADHHSHGDSLTSHVCDF